MKLCEFQVTVLQMVVNMDVMVRRSIYFIWTIVRSGLPEALLREVHGPTILHNTERRRDRAAVALRWVELIQAFILMYQLSTSSKTIRIVTYLTSLMYYRELNTSILHAATVYLIWSSQPSTYRVTRCLLLRRWHSIHRLLQITDKINKSRPRTTVSEAKTSM